MQQALQQLAAPCSRPCGRAAPRQRRGLRGRGRGRAAVTNAADGMEWLEQQAVSVEEEVAAETAAAQAAAADDVRARSVGLHLRGRGTVFKDSNTNEYDPERSPYHQVLSDAALHGEYERAEEVMGEMAAAGDVPGARAYHALVYAHVRGGQAGGALDAIRRCWDAGVTPLPETYAAVVLAHVAAGDLDTAEAVLASNRRAGVDCTKSWQQLVAALFREGRGARALEAYSQGEAEGLEASPAIYQGLIQHLCSEGTPDVAASVLALMQERGQVPTERHYGPVIAAFAASSGAAAAAEAGRLLAELGGVVTRSRVGSDSYAVERALSAVADSYVEARLVHAASGGEVLETMEVARAAVGARNLGLPAYAAQMRAALRLQDVQMAFQSFRQLRRMSLAPLSAVDDDLLAQLVLAVGRARLPARLWELMAAISGEARSMPAAAMERDARGYTVLGAWVQERLQGPGAAGPAVAAADAADAPPPEPLLVDGVPIDPVSLRALDAKGGELAVTRMGTRELRAELAARRAPVSGNKKELQKKVQKLRAAEAGDPAAAEEKKAAEKGKKGKAEVVVTVEGEAVGLAEGYEGVEVVERGEDDDGDDDGGAWETPAMLPEELEQLSARRSAGDDGDDLLYGDDDDEGAALGEDEAIARALAEAYARLSSTPLLGAPEAGPLHAAELMLCAVRELQAQPSPEDLAAVAAWAAATGDTAAAVALVAVLDRLPQPSAENQRMQEQLAELCAQKEVDLEAELQRTYGRRQQDAGGDAGDAELDSLVAL